MNSQQFANHFTTGVRKSFVNGSAYALKKTVFSKIFGVERNVDYSEDWTSTEGVTPVDWVNESEPLVNIETPEGYPVNLVAAEFGGVVRISKKHRIKAKSNNNLMWKILAARKNQVMVAMMSFLERKAHGMLNNGFTTQLAPDGQPIFGTHAWNSSNETFTNILTGNPVFGAAALDLLDTYQAGFSDAQGTEMPLNFDTIIVASGSAAAREAKRLLASNITPTQVSNVNIYEGGKYRVIETPYLTNPLAWFAKDSTVQEEESLQVRFVTGVEVEDMITAENLDYVYPVIQSVKLGCVNMPFEWVGSTGAGS